MVSSLNTGRQSPFKGVKGRWSDEQKKMIGDSQRNKPKSEEFRIKCSNRMKGKPGFFKGHKHTEEWKMNHSLSQSGDKHYNYKGRNSTGENRSEYAVSLRREKNGFTKEIFKARLDSQLGLCGICEITLTKGLSSNSASADHCHQTMKPRGILCKRCNLMIGHARDNVKILERSIDYLNFWKRTA